MTDISGPSGAPHVTILQTNERAKLDPLSQSKHTHMLIEYLTTSSLYPALTRYDPRIPISLLRTTFLSSNVEEKEHESFLTFRIDGEKKTMDRDTFVHKILRLKESQQPIVYPTNEKFQHMIEKMGGRFTESIDPRPYRANLPPAWNFLYGLIIGCLFGHKGSVGRCSNASCAVMYGIFFNVNTDIGTLIWEDFLKYIPKRTHSGSFEIHHARYWTLIISYMYAKGLTKTSRLPDGECVDITEKSAHNVIQPELFQHPILLPDHIIKAIDPKSPALAQYNEYIRTKSSPVEKQKKRPASTNTTKPNSKRIKGAIPPQPSGKSHFKPSRNSRTPSPNQAVNSESGASSKSDSYNSHGAGHNTTCAPSGSVPLQTNDDHGYASEETISSRYEDNQDNHYKPSDNEIVDVDDTTSPRYSSSDELEIQVDEYVPAREPNEQTGFEMPNDNVSPLHDDSSTENISSPPPTSPVVLKIAKAELFTKLEHILDNTFHQAGTMNKLDTKFTALVRAFKLVTTTVENFSKTQEIFQGTTQQQLDVIHAEAINIAESVTAMNSSSEIAELKTLVIKQQDHIASQDKKLDQILAMLSNSRGKPRESEGEIRQDGPPKSSSQIPPLVSELVKETAHEIDRQASKLRTVNINSSLKITENQSGNFPKKSQPNIPPSAKGKGILEEKTKKDQRREAQEQVNVEYAKRLELAKKNPCEVQPESDEEEMQEKAEIEKKVRLAEEERKNNRQARRKTIQDYEALFVNEINKAYEKNSSSLDNTSKSI